MRQLQLMARINQCEENGWSDLLSKVEQVTESLIETPSAGRQIKSALMMWGNEVDQRCNSLPKSEDELAARNPFMSHRQLGAD